MPFDWSDEQPYLIHYLVLFIQDDGLDKDRVLHVCDHHDILLNGSERDICWIPQ